MAQKHGAATLQSVLGDVWGALCSTPKSIPEVVRCGVELYAFLRRNRPGTIAHAFARLDESIESQCHKVWSSVGARAQRLNFFICLCIGIAATPKPFQDGWEKGDLALLGMSPFKKDKRTQTSELSERKR